MGANPHANGGLLLKIWRCPIFSDYAVDVPRPGTIQGGSHAGDGTSASRCDQAHANAKNFRIVGPDETAPIASTLAWK